MWRVNHIKSQTLIFSVSILESGKMGPSTPLNALIRVNSEATVTGLLQIIVYTKYPLVIQKACVAARRIGVQSCLKL